jgi:hypothetical protein
MYNYQNQQSGFYNDMLQMFQLFDQNNTSYFLTLDFSENKEGNLYVYPDQGEYGNIWVSTTYG